MRRVTRGEHRDRALGFVTAYARTSTADDKAETFAFLARYGSSPVLPPGDTVLAKKVTLMSERLTRVCPMFSSGRWREGA